MRITGLKLILILFGLSFLMGCENTVKGMKQDIREGTSNNSASQQTTQQTTIVKRTEIVYPSPQSPPQSLPTSPPPLQTPPQ